MLRPQVRFQPSRRRSFWNSSAPILAANGAIALLLIGLAIAYPPATKWISEAVQAEFTGADAVPDASPTQIAEPAFQTRTVRNN
jgi:hypothetical protein